MHLGPDGTSWGKKCQRSNVSATAGNHSAFFVFLPAKVNSLKITVSGGTGEADLYYNPNGWATTSDWTARSVKTGNAETLTIKKPPAGYVYISSSRPRASRASPSRPSSERPVDHPLNRTAPPTATRWAGLPARFLSARR
ncbi:PPC domain-containing protein [Kitasatospora albolonga]|uniref:PPC domain-containing protein n=1 Tax=Kitasatospora albolonga TaxID=68173 RepID=UPI0031F0EAD8